MGLLWGEGGRVCARDGGVGRQPEDHRLDIAPSHRHRRRVHRAVHEPRVRHRVVKHHHPFSPQAHRRRPAGAVARHAALEALPPELGCGGGGVEGGGEYSRG